MGQIPIAYWNVGGIIFYTNLVENTEELLTLTTFALVRQFIRSHLAQMSRTIVGAIPRIAMLVRARVSIDTTRLETHFYIAILLGLV